MRGEYGEGNPWQFAMGEAVEPTVNSMGVKCLRVEYPSEVIPTIQAGLTMAFKAERSVAILLSQKLLGAKSF